MADEECVVDDDDEAVVEKSIANDSRMQIKQFPSNVFDSKEVKRGGTFDAFSAVDVVAAYKDLNKDSSLHKRNEAARQL